MLGYSFTYLTITYFKQALAQQARKYTPKQPCGRQPGSHHGFSVCTVSLQVSVAEGPQGWGLRTETGMLALFPQDGKLEFYPFPFSRRFLHHTDSDLLFVSQARKGKVGEGRRFYFCHTAAYLPQSQPLRPWIYKFSCNGFIIHEQHTAPAGPNAAQGGGPNASPTAGSCWRHAGHSTNEDLGLGHKEGESGGPLILPGPQGEVVGPPCRHRSQELVTLMLVP